MSDFSATDVAFTGIRFVREHPRTIAIWAGVQIVVSLVFGAIFVGMAGPYLGELQGLNQARPADPAQVFAVMAHVLPAYALFVPLGLAFYSVLHAAMARAVLRPSDEGFAYIRFGLDEGRQCLLILLFAAVVLGAEFLAFFVSTILVVAVSAASGGFRPWAVAFCVLLCGTGAVYTLVRLSLASALTFDTGQVNLFGSWRLTRGRFWKMLGTYLLVLGLALVIGLLTLIITAAVAAVLGGIGALASIFGPSTISLSAFFAPARLGVNLVWALVTPLFWSLVYMPPVAIYARLAGASDDGLTVD